MTIQEMEEKAYATACDHGWHEGDNDMPEDVNRQLACIALVGSELGEAVNAVREDERADWEAYDGDRRQAEECHADGLYDDGRKRQEDVSNFERHIKDTLEDELADVVIRIADFCGAMGIDLERQIAAKMAYNETRSYRHGGKLA
jgi:NTP pyrophosphatase (non-canonical NTP hydrolase)